MLPFEFPIQLVDARCKKREYNSPVTFCKEVISSIDMNHTIFEHRLPLVLDPLDLLVNMGQPRVRQESPTLS